jgi:two-component sensor histidine kinase
MLNLQSKLIKDKNIVAIFKESQNRIKTMALIHENLYQSKSLENINFTEYITYLVDNLFISYNISEEVIVLKTDIADNMKLSINQAISCGLILNELVSNALKYAFPDGRKGKIFIGLSLKNNGFELIFADNGIGIPKDIDIKNANTLGLSLVNALINQLKGNIEIKRQNGTKFIITFPEKISKNHQ